MKFFPDGKVKQAVMDLRRRIRLFLTQFPKPFYVIWVGTFINRLGSFVIPFLAIYLARYRELSFESIGLVTSCFGIGSCLAGPLGGQLSDRFGRRAIMLAALWLGALSVLSLILCRTVFQTAAVLFCLGLFGDMYRPACSAAIADIVPEKDRPRAYGLIYWAINLGFSAATAIAGVIATYSFSVLFILDALTTLIFAVMIYKYVPESKPNQESSSEGHAQRRQWLGIIQPFKRGLFVAFFVLSLLTAFVFIQFHVALPLDLQNRGISAKEYGFLISLNGILIVFLQPFVAEMIQKASPARVMALAALLTGIGFGMTGFVNSMPLYVLSVAIWTVGEICSAPVTPTVIASLAPANQRGTYMGAYHLSWGTASILTPIFGTLILGQFGSKVLWGACFVIGSAVAIGYLLIDARIRKKPARN